MNTTHLRILWINTRSLELDHTPPSLRDKLGPESDWIIMKMKNLFLLTSTSQVKSFITQVRRGLFTQFTQIVSHAPDHQSHSNTFFS